MSALGQYDLDTSSFTMVTNKYNSPLALLCLLLSWVPSNNKIIQYILGVYTKKYLYLSFTHSL